MRTMRQFKAELRIAEILLGFFLIVTISCFCSISVPFKEINTQAALQREWDKMNGNDVLFLISFYSSALVVFCLLEIINLFGEQFAYAEIS